MRLPRLHDRRLLVEHQTDAARAGEGDQRHLLIVGENRPDFLTNARQVISDARRQTGLDKRLHQLGADHRRLLGRLHHDRIAGYQCRRRHAAQNGEREVPGRDDDADAARLVGERIVLSRQVHGRWPPQPAHFACIVLTKINRLTDIGIGLAPALGALEYFPSA